MAMIAVAFAMAAWSQLHWTPPPPPPPVVAAELPHSDDPAVAALVAEVTRLRDAAAPKPPPPPRAPMEKMQDAILERAKASVDLVLGLVGAMTFFLGVMKVAEDGGLLKVIARLVRPLLTAAFPDVPPDHPAMAAMVLNLSANALGLGNAATPFGIKAMRELSRLNPFKGTASNAMVLFLAINTSGVTLLPTGTIVLRQTLGSRMPAAVLPTTLFATACSTVFAILVVKLIEPRFATAKQLTPPEDVEEVEVPSAEEIDPGYPLWVSWLAIACLLAMIPVSVLYGAVFAPWIVPGMAFGMLAFGAARGVKVYESFVAGARDGWDTAIRIIPNLIAILCAVGMFQASGALDMLVGVLDPITSPLGLPGAALPMALLRPLSGSGAMGLMVSILQNPATGPDTYTGLLVSTIMGCTETTFYVLAVYFGSVGVTRIRHALIAGLAADFAGVAGAVVACKLYLAWNS